MKKRLKTNGIIMVIAALTVALFPAFFFRSDASGAWERCLRIFGVSFILLGQLFRTSGRGYKSEHSQRGASLIQGGPYSLVRNPMYAGILLIGIGVVLMLFKWWVACVFLIIFIIRYLSLTFAEEKKLKALFGREYVSYQERVPRIIPTPGSLFRQDAGVFLPLKPSWIKKEIGTILAVLLGTLVVGSWRQAQGAGLQEFFSEALWLLAVVLLFIALAGYLIKRTRASEKNAPV